MTMATPATMNNDWCSSFPFNLGTCPISWSMVQSLETAKRLATMPESVAITIDPGQAGPWFEGHGFGGWCDGPRGGCAWMGRRLRDRVRSRVSRPSL